MQLPENIRRMSTFRVKALVTPDGPPLETSKFSLYFSGSCIPTYKNLLIFLALPPLAQTVQDYILQ
jgi:hypothetical protein